MVQIPSSEVLRDEMLRMGTVDAYRACLSRGKAASDANSLRYGMLFDLVCLLECGATEASLEDVLAANRNRKGHLRRYDDDQIAEAWLAVEVFCATGQWPEGDVALLGSPATTPM